MWCRNNGIRRKCFTTVNRFSGLSAQVLTAVCDDLTSRVPDTYANESFLQDIPQRMDIMPVATEKGDEKEKFLQEILQQPMVGPTRRFGR